MAAVSGGGVCTSCKDWVTADATSVGSCSCSAILLKQSESKVTCCPKNMRQGLLPQPSRCTLHLLFRFVFNADDFIHLFDFYFRVMPVWPTHVLPLMGHRYTEFITIRFQKSLNFGIMTKSLFSHLTFFLNITN